jgi:hypothetical protein
MLGGGLEAALAAGGWLICLHYLVLVVILLIGRRHSALALWSRGTRTAGFFVLSAGILVFLGGQGALAAAGALLWTTAAGAGAKWAVRRATGLELPFHAACLLLFTAVELVLFVLGIFGAAIPAVHWILAAAGAAPGLLLLGESVYRGRTAVAVRQWRPSVPEILWLEGLFLLGAIALVHAALPEVLVDAAQLHIPKSMLMSAAGGIRGILEYPYQPFYPFPSYTHVLFSFALTTLGETGPMAFSLAMLIPWTGAVMHLGRLAGVSRTAALAVAVLCLGVPAHFWMTGSGYLDFPATALGLGGCALLAESILIAREGDGAGNFRLLLAFLAGVLLAAAANTKLNLYVLTPAVFCSLAATSFLSGRGLCVRLGLATAAGGLLVCVPHWAGMFALTDNPFYPMLNGMFQSPYWNNAMPVQQFSFHDFSFWEWILLPYFLVARTSWFGLNLDGSSGFWLLYFFPVFAVLRPRRDSAAIALAMGGIIYGVLLGLYGSIYFRYYMPAFPLLGLAIARGITSRRFGLAPNRLAVVFASAAVILTLPQLKLSHVPDPFLFDSYIKKDTGNYWLDRHYAARMTPFKEAMSSTPPDARFMVDGLELVSAMPRLAFETDIATINFSGLNGVHPQDVSQRRSAHGRWLTEEVCGFSYASWARSRESGEALSPRPFQAMIESLGDLYVVGNIWSYANQAVTTNIINADRLVYSSATESEGGVQSRFLIAFRVNDQLFPKPNGVGFEVAAENVDLRPPLLEPPGWLTSAGDGQMIVPETLRDPLAHPGGTLFASFFVPPGSTTVNLVFNLRYVGEPEYAAGMGLQFFDAERRLLQATIPSIFSAEGQPLAAYVVREAVPPGAMHLLLILSASPGKKIGIGNYSLFFEV